MVAGAQTIPADRREPTKNAPAIRALGRQSVTDEVLKGRAQISGCVAIFHPGGVVAKMIGQSLQAPRLEMGMKLIDQTEDAPELVSSTFRHAIGNLRS